MGAKRLQRRNALNVGPRERRRKDEATERGYKVAMTRSPLIKRVNRALLPFCLGNWVGTISGLLFDVKPDWIKPRSIAVYTLPVPLSEGLRLFAGLTFLIASTAFGVYVAKGFMTRDRATAGDEDHSPRAPVRDAALAFGIGTSVGFLPTVALLALLPSNWRVTFWPTRPHLPTYDLVTTVHYALFLVVVFVLFMAAGFLAGMITRWITQPISSSS